VTLAACGASTTTTTTVPPVNAFNPQLVGPPAKPVPPQKTQTTPKGATKTTKTKHATVTTHPTGGGSATVTVVGPGTTHTVTVTHNTTVTKRVVVNKTVPIAGVPSQAQVPSTSVTHVGAFQAAGGTIGCAIGGGTARCDISKRTWSPPRQPSSCKLAWGQGLSVGPSGAGHFVCAGNSTLNPTGHLVSGGVDVKTDGMTCQVRSTGVTCFDGAGHGFFIGKTGYTTF
jgi:hypothetical protein